MNINFSAPSSWSSLSDSQFLWLLGLHAKEFTPDEIKIHAWLRFAGVRVLAKSGDGSFLLKHRKDIFPVRPLQVQALLPFFDWAANAPSYPARPSRLQRKEALPADFRGVPFGIFLQADNLYQGFLATRDESLLDALLSILYPGLSTGKRFPRNRRSGSNLSARRLAALYWMISLKSFLSAKFHNFLRPAAESQEENLLGSPQASPEEAMNTQIRALTKGDISKEEEILSLDTWRALTELDAQAREYQSLKQKINEK